jgi:hypothetical protein
MLIRRTHNGKATNVHEKCELTNKRSSASPKPRRATQRGAILVKITTVDVDIKNTPAILTM